MRCQTVYCIMQMAHPLNQSPAADQPMGLPCRQLLDLKTELGEGLLWDAERHRLLMTDIVKGRLIDIDVDAGTSRSWTFDETLGWVLKTGRPGAYLLGLRSGIAGFDIEQPECLQWINRDFPGHPSHRLNDACADAQGRVWYGSMSNADPMTQGGELASYAPKDGMQIHDCRFTVTNGPVVSADGQHLYFNDTLKGTVYRYRKSADGGTLSERLVFAQFDGTQGLPDGMCLDAGGHLWVAMWGGGSVVQLDPGGCVVRRVAIPAKNVTNVCFFGSGLDRLVVSSSTIDMSDDDRKRYPQAGALFEVLNHGCVGLPTHRVNMDSSWT